MASLNADAMLPRAEHLVRSQPLRGALAVAGGTALLAFLNFAYQDYRAYVALGPHGLPDTFRGWCTQLQMVLISRPEKETTVPAPWSMADMVRAYGTNAARSFLTRPLSPRSGSRPQLCKYVAPQRQMNDRASQTMKEDMFAYLRTLAEVNPAVLQVGNSFLEGPVPGALQLRQDVDIPDFLTKTKGEIAHIHPPDGSTHLELSPADSKTVIELGWGQRHRLSGPYIPWGYTLVYAPKDRREMEEWKNVVGAAARYCAAELEAVQDPKET
ncbi:Uu.00g123340.m01.CDS01 [Anthostomella pinea]|uniref:Uu.00g123340.m01.CDS01 n=1 Tax=Anthostomella pinea TaxID=933095 RepID=A0AAI8VHD5_9PEZI|nr:Uu.00g123340.m01.CDS01 [Anthostomella pinea]